MAMHVAWGSPQIRVEQVLKDMETAVQCKCVAPLVFYNREMPTFVVVCVGDIFCVGPLEEPESSLDSPEQADDLNGAARMTEGGYSGESALRRLAIVQEEYRMQKCSTAPTPTSEGGILRVREGRQSSP